MYELVVLNVCVLLLLLKSILQERASFDLVIEVTWAGEIPFQSDRSKPQKQEGREKPHHNIPKRTKVVI
jgi:hypothetical protein